MRRAAWLAPVEVIGSSTERVKSTDETLQAGQVGIAALFIIDFYPNVELLGGIRGVDARKLRGTAAPGLCPNLLV